MKKMFLMALAMVFTLSAYASDVNKKVNVSSFDQIDVSSFFSVTIFKGGKEKVDIVIDDELEPYLVAKVTGNTLRLGLDTHAMPERLRRNMGERTLKAEVVMSSLTKLEVSGAAKVTSDDTFNVMSFEGDFSGAAKIESLYLSASDADFDISGATKANISLDKVAKADMEISGASSVRLEGAIKILEAEVSGAANFKANGSFSEISVDCSGASKSTVKGTTSNAKYDASGASKIDAESMTAKFVEVDASGASSIECNVKERLVVELSGASSLYYYGAENVAIDVREISRGCSLKKR